MLDGEPQRCTSTKRVAQDVDLLVRKLLEHDGQVVPNVDEVDGPIAQHRSSVSVEIDGDDLSLLGERRKQQLEHVDGAETTVQQQQRLTATMNLVVVVDTVREDVALLRGRSLR